MIEEKKLTKAELKKREEVAKAIEKENPNMPMDKKMAIATATAKKVAEEEDPCWDGYMQRGMKKKDGKDVPNCVPKEEVAANSVAGGGVDMAPNAGPRVTKKPLKRFKNYMKGEM